MAITGAGASEEVQVAISGDSQSLNEATNSALDSLGSLKKAAGLASAALAGLGTAGLAAAAKSAADFEQQMVEVEKVTNPETARRMGDAIQEMASRMPTAQRELAQITAQAGRFGIRGTENIERFTETVSKMAIATDLSTSRAGESFARLSTLMDAPISKVGDMGNVVNELSNTMATSSSEIVDAALRSSGTLAQLGASSQDIFALNAAMNAASESAERAGTRLRRMGQEIQDPANVQDLAAALGITTEEFATMREENPVGLFRMMASTMNEGEAAADTLRKTLSTTSQQALTALAQNLEGLSSAQTTANEQMRNGTSLQEEYASASDTFYAELQVVQNQLRNIGIQIGERVLPVLSELLSGVSDAIESFSSMNEETDGLLGTLGLVGSVIVGVGGFFAWLATGPVGVLAGAITALAAAFAADFGNIRDVVDDTVAVVAEFVALSREVLSDYADAFGMASMSATDFAGIVESAVARAVNIVEGLLQSARRYLELYRAFWEANGEGIANSVADTYQSIRDRIESAIAYVREEILGPFAEEASALWEEHGAALQEETMATWQAIWGVIEPVLETVLGAVEVALETLAEFWDDHGEQIMGVVEMAFEAIATVVGVTLDQVTTLVRASMALIRGDFDSAWGLIRELVENAMEFYGNIVEAGLNRVVRFVSNIGVRDIRNAFAAVGSGIRTVALGIFGAAGLLWTLVSGFVVDLARYIGSGEAYHDLRTAFGRLLDGVVRAWEVAFRIGGRIFGVVRGLVDDIATYISSGQAYSDLKSAFEVLVDAILAVFEGLYQGLIGNSLIPEMIADIEEFLKNAGKNALSEAAQVMVDAVESVFHAISFDVDWPEPPDIVEKAWNGNLNIDWPDPPPSIGGGGGFSGGGGGDDDDDGGGGGGGSGGGQPGSRNPGLNDGRDDGGGFVGLSTGGLIDTPGLAVLHEGERVVPSAQVSDRGEVTVNGGVDADEIVAALEETDRTDELLSELQMLQRLVAELSTGDVSRKDILEALDIARDRRENRDPLSTS